MTYAPDAQLTVGGVGEAIAHAAGKCQRHPGRRGAHVELFADDSRLIRGLRTCTD